MTNVLGVASEVQAPFGSDKGTVIVLLSEFRLIFFILKGQLPGFTVRVLLFCYTFAQKN
jgi:hypothetical protein